MSAVYGLKKIEHETYGRLSDFFFLLLLSKNLKHVG